MKPKRIMLFGTGGGSGVTRFLVDSAATHKRLGNFDPMVVFRRKRNPLGQQFIDDLEADDVPWAEVRAAPKIVTITQLRRRIREFRPDIFVVHGHSDHIWGRMAAIRERVPIVIMVEQNIERYVWLQRLRSVALARHTDAIVAVSHGVGENLVRLGHPRHTLHVIHNGTLPGRFDRAAEVPLDEREPAVLMAARFARQKDHASLIRAAGLLRDRGTPVKIRLAGCGSSRHERKVRRLVTEFGLRDQVEFLGPRDDIAALLAQHRVSVLSTRYEGLAIAVVEAMVAGCAVVASNVVGVEDVIEHGKTGWLVKPGDPESLARGITEALGPEGVARAAAGRGFALRYLSMEKIVSDYESLFRTL